MLVEAYFAVFSLALIIGIIVVLIIALFNQKQERSFTEDKMFVEEDPYITAMRDIAKMRMKKNNRLTLLEGGEFHRGFTVLK